YGEGWSNAPVLVLAEATTLRGGRSAIQVRWAVEAPPLDAGAASVHQTEAVGGLLVQRRSGDGQWQDLAVLPAGTTVMTDTDIAANTVYAYRVKVLAADGNDSDYTGTMPVVQSLPALPGAPTIVEVVALGADRLEIRWTPPAGSVVDN